MHRPIIVCVYPKTKREAYIAMHSANRGVLAELKLLSHTHKLQARCSKQVAQQAEVGLVGYSWGAGSAGSPAPLH